MVLSECQASAICCYLYRTVVFLLHLCSAQKTILDLKRFFETVHNKTKWAEYSVNAYLTKTWHIKDILNRFALILQIALNWTCGMARRSKWNFLWYFLPSCVLALFCLHFVYVAQSIKNYIGKTWNNCDIFFRERSIVAVFKCHSDALSIANNNVIHYHCAGAQACQIKIVCTARYD